MRIGKTDFGEHIRAWDYEKFLDVYGGNVAVKRELAAYGLSLEKAYEKLTGKKAVVKPKKTKKDAVSDVHKSSTKDKD